MQQLALREAAVHVSSFNRPNLHYTVHEKTRKTYDEVLAQARAGGAGIVYCLSRARVDELAAKLAGDGVRALPYHAGLDADTRRENQEQFIRDDAQVMVATVAFGMGINKPDVRWVIHHDLPKTLESYYQEAGRAGRDGDPARCTLYFGVGDIRTAEFLISQKVHPETGEPLEEEQRIAKMQLRRVLDYAQSSECRRVIQLRYFGEEFRAPCGGCDNCLMPREQQDWTREAQMFLSTLARLAQRGQRYGTQHVVDLLRGADNEKVQRLGHQTVSTYGIGKHRSLAEWRHLSRALEHQGLVTLSGDEYPVLVLNEDSMAVLRGTRTVQVSAMAEEKAASTKQRRSKGPSPAPTNAEEALFQQLRSLRKQLADAQGLPPYVVFADAALRAMAQAQPVTLAAFAEISGVGKAKLERYGPDFVAAIKAAMA